MIDLLAIFKRRKRAELTAKKACSTLRNNWPLFSMATKVLSKVGGAGWFAIA